MVKNNMKCDICPNYCEITEESNKTACKMDPFYDDENRIYTCNIEIEPIESNFYHFLPGSKTLSIGLVGCNLECPSCENYKTTQFKNDLLIPKAKYSPRDIVNMAYDNDAETIIWKFSEPTIHPKWIIKTAQIAQEYEIKTAIVTNGFSSPETLEKLKDYIDAVCLNIKSPSDIYYKQVCKGRLKPIISTLNFYYKKHIHLEVEYTLIPEYNDTPKEVVEFAKYIKKISTDKIPIHIKQFTPVYKLSHIKPTSEKYMIKTCDRLNQMGFKYIYPEITTSQKYKNNTYCHHCKHLLIKRSQDYQIDDHITENQGCPHCNHKAYVIE